MKKQLYKHLASLIEARANCEANANAEWHANHTRAIRALVKAHMPSGSGFDCGTVLNIEASTPDKLVFDTSFHHIHAESGSYDGWTEHEVHVRPSLSSDFRLRISGRDRNDIKDYIADVFYAALRVEVELTAEHYA